MERVFSLPAAATERARAWLGGGETVAPRPASTVILVREGPVGVEVFLLRRHLTMAFAPGALVFPGGGVDPRDAEADLRWDGPDPRAWAATLGTTPERARQHVCAAVRETFEESGVLLAAAPGTPGLVAADGTDWDRDRRRLVDRELALSTLLEQRGLAIRTDLLRPWARWITPEHEPRRYDTHFFLAVVPPGQAARNAGGEASEATWCTPADALERAARGRATLLPPTRVCLEELADATSLAHLLDSPRRARTVRPRLEERGNDLVLVVDLEG